MTFLFAEPTQLWLEISSANQSESWQQSQQFSTPSNRWRAYLNRICLNAFLPWLQEEYVPEATPWQDGAALPAFWEVVNGTAIAIGEKRLVLLPEEAIDDDELRVPQEWIDIPKWTADYYLAAQVNPDEQWVRIWGYTTHQQLKVDGSYDPRDRTYCLAGDDLIQDVNVLWVSQQLCPEEATRETVAPLPPLPVTQAENLLQRLGNPKVTFPRLAVPFVLWGALLENENWRQQLYRQRQGDIVPAKILVNLRQWFENIFETGWQSLEDLDLALSARRASNVVSETGIRRVKAIALESQLEGQSVALLVDLTPEAQERVGIRVQLYPGRGSNYLPANISLALLSESGETIKSVQARREDNFIQIQRFKCPLGSRFSLQVALDQFSIIEDFMV